MDIRNSVAFVTGANRGIGKAFVAALQEAGARKIYAAARDIASLAEIHGQDSERIVPIALDVTDPNMIGEAAKRARDVTLLVNNAGVARFAGALAEWRRAGAASGRGECGSVTWIIGSANTGMGVEALAGRILESLGFLGWQDERPTLFTPGQVAESEAIRVELTTGPVTASRWITARLIEF